MISTAHFVHFQLFGQESPFVSYDEKFLADNHIEPAKIGPIRSKPCPKLDARTKEYLDLLEQQNADLRHTVEALSEQRKVFAYGLALSVGCLITAIVNR